MNSAKNLYLALVLALAQIIRLSGDKSLHGNDLNRNKYFFGFQTILERRLEIDKNTRIAIIKNVYLWVIAYLYVGDIRIDGDEENQKITVPKNSLRVMICKEPENFDEDKSEDKDKEYYMVQKGELIGAFETSQDWVGDKEKEDTSTCGGLPKVDWSHKLNSQNFDWSDFELLDNGFNRQLSEPCKPDKTKSAKNRQELYGKSILLSGFDTDTTNSTNIKIGDNTLMGLTFLIERHINLAKTTWLFAITMYVITEDPQLLQALETKWAAIKTTNDKNADPSQSNQILNENGSNQHLVQNEGEQSQTTQNQEQNSFNDNSISQKQQTSAEQHPSIIEDATSQKESPKSPKNIKDLIPNSETDNPILKKDKKEEKNGAEGDKNQKSDNKLESSASKEKDKSRLENPYIYGGLIVISILGLGLVVYMFHKRETISEEDK